jgi:excisionase family DNA binding protein
MSINVARVQHEPIGPHEEGERVSEPQPFVPGGLLTVSEVAAAMRVSNMTVYRLIKGGELPAVRVGKNYRIRESDLERFLEDRSVRTEDP